MAEIARSSLSSWVILTWSPFGRTGKNGFAFSIVKSGTIKWESSKQTRSLNHALLLNSILIILLLCHPYDVVQVLGWKTQVLYLPICGSLEEHCQKNSRKKSTGYVKKYDQSSSSGLIYDGSEVMMVMSTEALLDWIIDSGVAGELNASDEEKDSLAQVWYKRLGHISEVGLLVLEKHELFGKKSLRKVTSSQFWGRKTHYSGS
ncbi:hypothetical protein Tco_1062525, partial [Tanacetum coccineum]